MHIFLNQQEIILIYKNLFPLKKKYNGNAGCPAKLFPLRFVVVFSASWSPTVKKSDIFDMPHLCS